jgi:hypothetical protein
MAWTEAQRDTLAAAIASGVLNVTYDGPPRRSVTYQSLQEMRDLLAEMERALNSTTARSYRVAAFRGL